MSKPRRIYVTCSDCHVVYPLWNETLLPIARCGRCHGSVVPDRAIDETFAASAVTKNAA